MPATPHIYIHEPPVKPSKEFRKNWKLLIALVFGLPNHKQNQSVSMSLKF